VVHASKDADAARRETSPWFQNHERPADMEQW